MGWASFMTSPVAWARRWRGLTRLSMTGSRHGPRKPWEVVLWRCPCSMVAMVLSTLRGADEMVATTLMLAFGGDGGMSNVPPVSSCFGTLVRSLRST